MFRMRLIHCIPNQGVGNDRIHSDRVLVRVGYVTLRYVALRYVQIFRSYRIGQGRLRSALSGPDKACSVMLRANDSSLVLISKIASGGHFLLLPPPPPPPPEEDTPPEEDEEIPGGGATTAPPPPPTPPPLTPTRDNSGGRDTVPSVKEEKELKPAVYVYNGSKSNECPPKTDNSLSLTKSFLCFFIMLSSGP